MGCPAALLDDPDDPMAGAYPEAEEVTGDYPEEVVSVPASSQDSLSDSSHGLTVLEHGVSAIAAACPELAPAIHRQAVGMKKASSSSFR